MCLPESVILASIASLFVVFQAILTNFKAQNLVIALTYNAWLGQRTLEMAKSRILFRDGLNNFRSIPKIMNFQNCAIPASITLACKHIFQVLASYLLVLPQYLLSIVTILASIEQVNTPFIFLQNPVLSRQKKQQIFTKKHLLTPCLFKRVNKIFYGTSIA